MRSHFSRTLAVLSLAALVTSCDTAAPKPVGTFTISSDGFPATAAQGGGAVGTVLLNRVDGHTATINLTATGAPTGVTSSFASAASGAGSTAVTFAVGAAVAPGSYPITITGASSGLTDQTTDVTLNVIAPPATASFSMPFCTTATPVWFAYQNTGDVWKVVTPVAGVFTFPATVTVTVAYTFVASNAQETDLNVLYATRTELAGKESRDCAGTKSLSGGVSGAAANQSIRVAMGATIATATTANPNFNLLGVADRALDLIATKGTITNSQSNLQVTPDLLMLQRNLNPASGSSLGTLDFAGQGFAPTSTNLTIGNLTAGDLINVGNTFWSSTNTYGVVHSFQPSTTTNTLYSMPVAKFQAGDLHELLVETFQSGFAFGRVNVAYLGSVADRTETMAPNLLPPSVATLSRSPYVRLRGQVAVQPEYPTATRFIYYQQGGSSSADRLIYIVTTAGFLGATPATTWDATIPQFGSVSGLDKDWLPSTPLIVYQAEAYSSPGPVMFGGVPAAGDIVKVAYRVESNGGLLRSGSAAPTLRASLKRGIETRQYLRR